MITPVINNINKKMDRRPETHLVTIPQYGKEVNT